MQSYPSYHTEGNLDQSVKRTRCTRSWYQSWAERMTKPWSTWLVQHILLANRVEYLPRRSWHRWSLTTYAQYVVEENPNDIRCILTTDAKFAFQSASGHNCYKVLCTDDTLRERFAPFFAHTHKGSQRIMWPAANMALRPSSGPTHVLRSSCTHIACQC